MSQNKDWIIDFEGLCILDHQQKSYLRDSHHVSEIIKKESKLLTSDVIDAIDLPPFDIKAHFKNLISYLREKRVVASEGDIYLYFVKLLLEGKCLWNNYLIGKNCIPERIIETLIARLDLSKDTYGEHSKILRYICIYLVYTFHMTNIEFLVQYNICLLESLKYEASVSTIRPIYEYIHLLHKDNTNILYDCKDCIDGTKTISHDSLFYSIKRFYTNISIMEKMIYVLYSEAPICIYHIVTSGHEYDSTFHAAHVKFIANGCRCHSFKPQTGYASSYVSKLNDMSNKILDDAQKKIVCFARFNY